MYLMLTQLPTKLHNDILKVSTIRFATYYPHYKEKREIIKCTFSFFLFQLKPELISLPGDLFDYVIKSTIYYLHYKDKLKMIESMYNSFLFWQLSKLLSSADTSSNCIVKVMRLLQDMPSIIWFVTYHLYHKNKFVGNLTQNYAGNVEPGQVAIAKKREPPRTLLIHTTHATMSFYFRLTYSLYFLYLFQALSLYFSLTLFEIYPTTS